MEQNVSQAGMKEIVRVLKGKHFTYTNPNIHQRLSWISEKVRYVKKDEKVMSSYWATSHDQVTATIQPFLIQAGVLVIPQLVESKVHTRLLLMKKAKRDEMRNEFLYTATVSVLFVNVDEPGEIVTVIVDGFAMDSQDKHPGIGLSYAVKSAMLKVFSLETGETDEGRLSGENLITETQSNTLKSAINQNADIFEMLQDWAGLPDNIGLDSLPVHKFDAAMDLVKTFNKQKAKRASGR